MGVVCSLRQHRSQFGASSQGLGPNAGRSPGAHAPGCLHTRLALIDVIPTEKSRQDLCLLRSA